jgi:hypothetical protein
MMRLLPMFRSKRGAAAAEMALVMPLLLVIMIGSVELGSFFYNEHILVKAVRDGARYAARQGFSNYDCSGEPGGTVPNDTRELVQTSLLAGGSDRLANWDGAATITVTETCVTTAVDLSNSTQTMSGIYNDLSIGTPIVRVSATVPYTPVIGAPFGFSGAGINLNATQEAAVMGI